MNKWLLLILLGGNAYAATVNLTCTAPTQNTDGTAITAALTYKAYWGVATSAINTPVVLAGPGCKGPVMVPDPPPGTSVTYYFTVVAIANDIESARSNTATKLFSAPFPTPNPPGNLIAAAGSEVFNTGTFDPSVWRVRLNRLYGRLWADTLCDESRPATEGYYRVPVAAVKWSGLLRTSYPLAKCERA